MGNGLWLAHSTRGAKRAAARIHPSQQKLFPFPLPGAVPLIKLINLFMQHNYPVGIAHEEQHVKSRPLDVTETPRLS